jgi:uncharacterized membrane protein YhaH (DUF805 family)
MDWYLKVWQKYAEFNGRARRKEYWMFTLFNIVIAVVAEAITLLLFTSTKSSMFGLVIGGALCFYFLAAFVPSLAVGVRRLHDIGMSGWLLLIALVPGIGGLVLLVLFLLDSNPGPNLYGPNPKASPQFTVNS